MVRHNLVCLCTLECLCISVKLLQIPLQIKQTESMNRKINNQEKQTDGDKKSEIKKNEN